MAVRSRQENAATKRHRDSQYAVFSGRVQEYKAASEKKRTTTGIFLINIRSGAFHSSEWTNADEEQWDEKWLCAGGER